MADSLSFYGQFGGHPFAYGAHRAEAMILPLEEAEDYVSLNRIPRSAFQTPVLCSFQEKYQLLEQVISSAFDLLRPLERCVMTAMMPGGMRLPARLLMEDVFLVHQVEDEVRRLQQAGGNFLVIEESLIRHPLESGDNTLYLRWYYTEQSQPASGWTAFLNVLSGLNIAPFGGA